MKIGIITHYDVHNHGAMLQLCALKRFLKNKNLDAFALRYTKNYDFLPEESNSKYNISLKSIPFYIKYLCKNGLKKTLFNRKKMKLLKSYRMTNNLIGDYYSKVKIDLLIIGSDEIFSIESGPNPWYYGVGTDAQKIISYAASFGPTTIETIKSKHLESYLAGCLKTIESISVRDKNSQQLVYELIGKKPLLVCDPVILYGYQSEMTGPRIIKKDYVLLYSYDKNFNSSNDVKQIKAFAKENNLIVVSGGFYHKWCDKNYNVNPDELIALFKYAKFVITDTFHGAVLSLITNANFSARINNNSNKLLHLLSQYSCDDRLFDECDCRILNSLYKKAINYSFVNSMIDKHRISSIEFLNGEIEKHDFK